MDLCFTIYGLRCWTEDSAQPHTWRLMGSHSGVISRVTMRLTDIRGLATLFIATHK